MNPIKSLLNLKRILKAYQLIRSGVFNKEILKDSKYWSELFKTLFSIKEVQEMLAGYKTYIVAVLLGLVTALHSMGKIDDSLFQMLLGLLNAGAISTVAAKINRMNR